MAKWYFLRTSTCLKATAKYLDHISIAIWARMFNETLKSVTSQTSRRDRLQVPVSRQQWVVACCRTSSPNMQVSLARHHALRGWNTWKHCNHMHSAYSAIRRYGPILLHLLYERSPEEETLLGYQPILLNSHLQSAFGLSRVWLLHLPVCVSVDFSWSMIEVRM